MEKNMFIDPNHVPDEHRVPFDVIELPSQGLLYKNKKSSVKVEYMTAYDENILTSPNLLSNGKALDILIEKKVKELGFEHNELLSGDRMAILLFLRTTGLGNEYPQTVFDEERNLVEGIIDLSKLKMKELNVKPNENGEFDFILPNSKKNIKFRLLTHKDEKEIESIDNKQKEKNGGVSMNTTLRLERSIMEIDGERDKMKISHILKTLSLIDVRKFNKYIGEIEPGINLETNARTQGGGSVSCFLRLGRNFWYPEI